MKSLKYATKKHRFFTNLQISRNALIPKITNRDEHSPFNNSNNNNKMKCILSASPATTVTATAAATTSTKALSIVPGMTITAAGYTLSSTTITLLSNAPLLAFALVQASGISPIVNIVQNKRTDNLSPFPFVSLYTNCFIWTLYGYLNHDATVLYANGAGIIAGLIYTGIFAKYTHISMLKYYAGSIAILAPMLTSHLWLDTSNAIQLLGSFGCASAVILMASPLATLKNVIKDKSTESIPFVMSLSMFLNGISWGSYGWFVAGDPYIYLPNILGTVAATAQLSLFAIYPSHKQGVNQDVTQQQQRQHNQQASPIGVPYSRPKK